MTNEQSIERTTTNCRHAVSSKQQQRFGCLYYENLSIFRPTVLKFAGLLHKSWLHVLQWYNYH